MSQSTPLRWLLVLTVACCFSSVASAGTILHDTDDSAYIALGAGYDSVGQITFEDSFGRTYFASGTLIASSTDANTQVAWVLTAAHVVEDVNWLEFGFDGVEEAATTFTASNWIPTPEMGW